MPEPQKVARLDLSTTDPAPDAVPTSFSEAPSKQTKRLHQLKPSAKIDLTTHGPVRPEPEAQPERKAKGKPNRPKQQHGGGRSKDDRRGGQHGGGRGKGRGQSAPSSGSTLADLLSADVLAKLRGE